MVAPFRRPETIDADGDQSVDRSQSSSIVDYHPQTTQSDPRTTRADPETTQGAPERPVAHQNIDGVEGHRDDADDEVSDRLIDDENDDENDEVRVQFLLVSVGQQHEEVRHGTYPGEREQHCGHSDHRRTDVTP